MRSPEIISSRREKIPQVKRPFTVPHFKAWSSKLVLDNGEFWQVEQFQLDFVRDVFRGFIENWLVIPEGNAKTTLAAALVLYHIRFRRGAMAVVAASSRDQAHWLYLAAQGFVVRSKLMEFRCQEGFRRIRCDMMGSRVQVFAADDRTGDGANFTLAILEELHRHKDFRLYRTWRGKTEKQGGQVIAISTAGLPDGEFETIRARMREAPDQRRKAGFLRAASDTTVIHDYSVPEGVDPSLPKNAKLANPLKAITVAQLKRKRESPSFMLAHWLRFVCGVAAVIDAAIKPEDWDSLAIQLGTVQPGEPVWIGVRVGQQGGCGIGIVAQRDDGVAVAIQTLPFDFPGLQTALRELCEIYDVQDIFVDPRQFGIGIDVLEASGLPLAQVYQSPVRLMEATSTFLQHVSSRTVYHDGDRVLRAQVLSATTKETTTGAYFEPSAETQAFIAVCMAVHEASKFSPEPTLILPSEGIA